MLLNMFPLSVLADPEEGQGSQQSLLDTVMEDPEPLEQEQEQEQEQEKEQELDSPGEELNPIVEDQQPDTEQDLQTPPENTPEEDSQLQDSEQNEEMSQDESESEEPSQNNIHEMTYVPAVEKTCEKDGNTEYWYCTLCDKYFSDEEGINEIEMDSWITEAEHHTYTLVGSREVNAAVIVSALAIPDFQLLSVTPGEGNVVVTQTGGGFEITVPAEGGSESKKSIRLFGTDGSEHLVYVNSDVTELVSQYVTSYFTVRWNDNGGHDSVTISERPNLDAIKNWYQLYFRIDGAETLYSFRDLLDVTGLEDTFAFDPKTLDLFDYIDTGDISKWTFNLSGLGLPKSYQKNESR